MKKVYSIFGDNKPFCIEEYHQDDEGVLHFSRVLFEVDDATEHECKMVIDMLNRLENINET